MSEMFSCVKCGRLFEKKRRQHAGKFCQRSCREKPFSERFSYEVAPTGCWNWSGRKGADGYGFISISGGQMRAHRYSMERSIGRPLIRNEHVLHACDNPACVNPSHLFIGNQRSNVADMIAKGRNARGERMGGARLNRSDVAAIRQSGKPQAQLARDFQVNQSTISLIKTGKTWAWLLDSEVASV